MNKTKKRIPPKHQRLKSRGNENTEIEEKWCHKPRISKAPKIQQQNLTQVNRPHGFTVEGKKIRLKNSRINKIGGRRNLR